MKRVNAVKEPAGGGIITRQEDRKLSVKTIARPEIDVKKARPGRTCGLANEGIKQLGRADQTDGQDVDARFRQ